jgi:PAS domain S-box-containing protein
MLVNIFKKTIRTRIFLAILIPLALIEAFLLYTYYQHIADSFILINETRATTISTRFFQSIRSNFIQLKLLEDRKNFLSIYSELKGDLEFASWLEQYDTLAGVSFVNEKGQQTVTAGDVDLLGYFEVQDRQIIASSRINGYLQVTVPLLVNQMYYGALHFWFSDQVLESKERDAGQLFVFIFLVSLLISSILAWWISSAIIKPIKKLAVDSRRIASGKLDQEITLSDTLDEIGLLASNFRMMQHSIREKIEELKDRNRQLAAEAAERKKSAEAFRVSERKFRDLADLLPQVIFETDMNCTITYVNRHGLQLFGYTDEEVQSGFNLTRVFPGQDRDRMIANVRKIMSGNGEKIENEYVVLKKDGTPFPCLVCSAPIFIQDTVVGLRGLLVDISERKKLEEQLRQSQKMEAIGTLAGGIAHDFNNILSAIFGYTELASLHAENREQLQRDLSSIQQGAERAKELIQQILTFSRQSKLRREPLRIGIVVSEAVKLLRSSIPATIEIREQIDAADQVVLADAIQIHQVVMNLCTNAYYAMREKGGILGIQLRKKEIRPGDPLLGSTIEPGQYLELEISDTGIGMDQATREKIFDPYFTTRRSGEGTGLGLAVVHGIVREHQGVIQVYSESGQGSCFRIYLPVSQVEIVETAAEPKPLNNIGGNRSILLVDDDLTILDIATKVFTTCGYKVTACSDPEEALAVFGEQSEKFDLLITDMTMPHMTGIELFNRVQQISPGFPTILCTGYSELINRNSALAMGIRAYIAKPVTMSDLVAVVKQTLDTGLLPS